MVQYVDDVNTFMEALKLGTRYIKVELKWSIEWENEDIESGNSIYCK